MGSSIAVGQAESGVEVDAELSVGVDVAVGQWCQRSSTDGVEDDRTCRIIEAMTVAAYDSPPVADAGPSVSAVSDGSSRNGATGRLGDFHTGWEVSDKRWNWPETLS
jgi:hypothetical protein